MGFPRPPTPSHRGDIGHGHGPDLMCRLPLQPRGPAPRAQRQGHGFWLASRRQSAALPTVRLVSGTSPGPIGQHADSSLALRPNRRRMSAALTHHLRPHTTTSTQQLPSTAKTLSKVEG